MLHHREGGIATGTFRIAPLLNTLIADSFSCLQQQQNIVEIGIVLLEGLENVIFKVTKKCNSRFGTFWFVIFVVLDYKNAHG